MVYDTATEQLQVHTTGVLWGQCWFMISLNAKPSITYPAG